MRFRFMLRFVLVVLVLAALGWQGITEGLDGLDNAETSGQRVASVAQILYGVSAVLSLLAVFSRRSWARLAVIAWAGFLTTTGAMAPVVWGGSTWLAGLAVGAGTLAVALLVVWGVHAHLRASPRVPVSTLAGP